MARRYLTPRKAKPPTMDEILDLLNDLIEWDCEMGWFENEVWKRARKVRNRMSYATHPDPPQDGRP